MVMRTELLPHQRRAVEKLIRLRIGALYMEMGTGKTRTALELVARRLNRGKIDRVLWLCPCSIKSNIRADILRHADGIDEERFLIRGIESLSNSDRLWWQLTRYVSEGVCMVIVDESNLVKNHASVRSQRVTNIAQQCPYRLILNGTPVSKNEADMFAQWYLLDWRILGYKSYYAFAANHLEMDERYVNRVRRVLNVDYLTDKIAPYSYMVKKDECLTLPEKKYSKVEFALTPRQYHHYDRMRDAYLRLTDKGKLIAADVVCSLVQNRKFQHPCYSADPQPGGEPKDAE